MLDELDLRYGGMVYKCEREPFAPFTNLNLNLMKKYSTASPFLDGYSAKRFNKFRIRFNIL